jgi:hypothetical protein
MTNTFRLSSGVRSPLAGVASGSREVCPACVIDCVSRGMSPLSSRSIFRSNSTEDGQETWVDAHRRLGAPDHVPGSVTGSPAKAADIQSLVAAVGMVVRSGMSNT